MSTSSKDFERFVHRIHELIERSGAEVTWDDRIPDPDNPAQGRQIDISIRRYGTLTLVECRLQRARQDVKWIEELIGRRASLGADGVIAVSSSGFTEGAKRKAERFGVLLRDLQNLTEAEISDWGRTHAVTLYFYEYTNVHLALVFKDVALSNETGEEVAEAFRSSSNVTAIFEAVAVEVDKQQLLPKLIFNQEVTFKCTLEKEGFILAGTRVDQVRVSGLASLVPREIGCMAVRAYGPPDTASVSRDVLVENFLVGETEIIHHGVSTSFLLDVSSLQMPPLSHLRFIRQEGRTETVSESFEIIGIDRFRVSAGTIDLTLIYESSR